MISLPTLYLFSGVRATAAGVVGLLQACIYFGIGMLFMLVLLRVLPRSTWAAAVAMTLYTFHTSPGGRPLFGRTILEG